MRDGFKRAGLALARLYPKGVSLFWVAPATVALVVIPELAQHIAEIYLGMFDSRASALAVSDAPLRMAFGYAKVAGLVLAFFATARFWWNRQHGGRWWDVREIGWSRFLAGFVIFFGIGTLPELLESQMDEDFRQWLSAAWAVMLLPALFVLLSGLFGDLDAPIRDMWRRAWVWLLLTALLLVIGYGPAFWLHGMNHKWAIGASPALIWSLMIFDSLLVGLMAGLTGTGFYLGYDAYRQRAQRHAGQT